MPERQTAVKLFHRQWKLNEMNKIIILNALVLCATLSFPPILLAQKTGFYAGVNLAQTRTDIANLTPDTLPIKDFINDKVINITASQDSTDNNTWLIYGGFQFKRFLAVEALYASLGEYTRKAQGRGSFGKLQRKGTYETTDNLKLDGYGLTALASLPIGDRFSVFGKFGSFHWSGKLNHATTFRTGGTPQLDPITSADKDSGYSPLLGFGGRYDLKHRVSLRAEWMQIKGVGGELSTGNSNVDIFSIGALISF